MSDEAVPALSARLRRPRRPGLAWWMIAVAGPRYARVGGPNVSGPPEDVPWLLMLRFARGRRRSELAAWVASGLAVLQVVLFLFVPRDSALGEAVWFVGPLQGFCAVAFFQMGCSCATLLPRTIRRAGTAADIRMLPIPPRSWLAAHVRLGLALSVWWTVLIIPGSIINLMRLWANPVAGILPLIISLAFGLAFNWMFYVARLIGGPIMFVWAWALLAYQPVMLLLYYESPPFKGPIVDLAFFAAIAGTGIYGMYRSFDAYPDIVRARTETRG